MNIYRHRFGCLCPVNKQLIIYELVIQSLKMIYVEKIVVACKMYEQAYHEKMADDLAKQFPGTFQVLTAHHHGVDLVTERGAVE